MSFGALRRAGQDFARGERESRGNTLQRGQYDDEAAINTDPAEMRGCDGPDGRDTNHHVFPSCYGGGAAVYELADGRL